jgi:hypothetical protein
MPSNGVCISIGATDVIRFLVILLDLYRNHGAAACIHGAMVWGATRTGDPRN